MAHHLPFGIMIAAALTLGAAGCGGDCTCGDDEHHATPTATAASAPTQTPSAEPPTSTQQPSQPTPTSTPPPVDPSPTPTDRRIDFGTPTATQAPASRTPTPSPTRTSTPTASATPEPRLRIVGDCTDVGTTGRVACTAGARVEAYLCTQPNRCADSIPPPAPAVRRLALLPNQDDRVRGDGTFDFEVEAPIVGDRVVDGPLLLVAAGLGRIDYGGAANSPRGSSGAAPFVVATQIDPSSDATRRLLGQTGFTQFTADELRATFSEARASTESLPNVIRGAERVEAGFLYDGQVGGDREVRSFVGLPADSYHVATLTLPGGCGDPSNPAQIDAIAGRFVDLPISRSAEIRVDGVEPARVQALYVTNILNGPGGGASAITCPDSRDLVCEASVAPGAAFRDFRYSVVFPVPGVARMVIAQQIRVAPIDPLDFIAESRNCVAPGCSYRECYYDVTVR